MNWIQNTISHLQHQNQEPEGNIPFLNDKGNPIDLRNIYPNQACFLIASGPSLNSMNLDPLRNPGIMTMGVNNSPKTFRPNLWTCVDNPARFLESIWRDPTIMKFCGTGKAKQRIWDYNRWAEAGCPANNDYYSKTRVRECPNVIYMKRNTQFNPMHFFTEPSINWGNHKNQGGGRSVMVAALKILYVLGFRRIYLLGVDFKMTQEYRYHFNEHRHNGAIHTNNSTYRKMISYYTQLSPFMKYYKFQVFNCTPQSGLTLFPYIDMQMAVENELKNFPNPNEEQTENMYVPQR